MTTGIYKIQNKFNNMIYIGQSVHIERRFQEHIKPSTNSSKIDKALNEYGANAFTFTIIEECSQNQLNEREDYWIQYYNCLFPNGYNIVEKNLQVHTNYNNLDKTTIQKIYKDLQYTDITFTKLAEKYEVSVSTISRINDGKTYKILADINYPIRKKQKAKKFYCKDCGKEITYGAIRCRKCDNKAKTFLPPVSRNKLKELIRTIPFTHIGQQFQVSDNTIKKWCDKYNLPRTKKEINKYSDKEWEKV